ncbi:polysaccharide lyase [Algibacter sp. AS12]|uniref:polysaccharide lyase n=1 Tax=Algibacter sp. AS12 TaxID=3135773 RepID=UPI00398BA4FC
MKKVILFILIVNGFMLNSCAQSNIHEEETPVVENKTEFFELNFDAINQGKYTKQSLISEGGDIRWALLGDRANIVADPKGQKGNVLMVDYPKGTVGPETNGVQFIKTLPASNEYYLDYYVFFEDGFDFRQGGKLPGLTSGGSTYTGGNHPDNGEGWSARYMWVKKGQAIVYFYYVDMKSKYGDSVTTGINFETGIWYRLTQRIKLNEDNLANGIMQVWVNGKEVINNINVRYRLWGKGNIDSFYFSTFHGGATEDWSPQNDSFALFDAIKVTKIKPEF